MNPRLTIALVVGGPTRVWHKRLLARLEAAGHEVRVIVAETVAAPRGVSTLLGLERGLYGARSLLFAPEPMEAGRGSTTSVPTGADLVVRLDGTTADDALVARFDGAAGDTAMIGAILAGRVPEITVTKQGRAGASVELAQGTPAVEDPTVLARALDHVLARLIVLLAQAVERAATTKPVSDSPIRSRSDAGPRGSAPIFFVETLARKIGRRLRGIGSDHWHVAWRVLEQDAVATARGWPSSPYRTLPDDGSAYYADPFPFEHDGRRFVFCEKYPYATQKGVIAVFELDAAGEPSEPEVVLERDAHLSYPQVFERDGTIFMLPEMGAAGRIELFRAERFPDRWVSHAILVDDVMAGDATFIEYQGRCWLFASVAGDGGSSWDQLALYHAPTLEGSWSPHSQNPVLIDAGAARPAGAMWVADGALWRVAQDCRDGYGAGLSLCRVDRLDATGFAQSVIRRLGPPKGMAADGVHTLNATVGIEAIDWRAPLRRTSDIGFR